MGVQVEPEYAGAAILAFSAGAIGDKSTEKTNFLQALIG
jgi:hypothetical protein